MCQSTKVHKGNKVIQYLDTFLCSSYTNTGPTAVYKYFSLALDSDFNKNQISNSPEKYLALPVYYVIGTKNR